MQTQPPANLNRPAQQSTPQKHRYRRHLILTALIMALGGLLSLAAFLPANGNQVKHHGRSAQKQTLAPLIQSITLAPNPPRSARALLRIADQIDKLLTLKVDNQQFSGSILVAQNGHLLLTKGYGLANQSTRTPNTSETRFYLGSVTKEFTALALLILQEQGKLHIDDPLCSHIPHCPSPWRPLSIHELLTHTSGIPQLDDTQLSGASPAAWIASFNNVPLQFRPGGEFQYCNICYQILAYVVQQVSGVPYTRFIKQMILDRLHMKDSGFDPHYYIQPNDAIGYMSPQIRAEQMGVHAGQEWSFLNGSGLLFSTVEDLYRWDQALSRGTLVSQETLAQAFTPYVTTNLFPGARYGYGWFISQAPVEGHWLFWHDGIIDGFRDYIGRYVDDNVTIIFLGNLSTINIIPLAHSIEQIIFANSANN